MMAYNQTIMTFPSGTEFRNHLMYICDTHEHKRFHPIYDEGRRNEVSLRYQISLHLQNYIEKPSTFIVNNLAGSATWCLEGSDEVYLRVDLSNDNPQFKICSLSEIAEFIYDDGQVHLTAVV